MRTTDSVPGDASAAETAADAPSVRPKTRAVGSVDHALRPLRRCARCGREGRNAYRPVGRDQAAAAWLCTHAEPCLARTRLQQRASAKRAHGRSPQSPISGRSLEDRRVLVVGADQTSRTDLAALVSEVTPDVECLALDRRTLEVLGNREFGLVVADVRRGDPIAILNGLARRLTRITWHGAAAIVVHGPGDDGPAVEALVTGTNVQALLRPVDMAALFAIVTGLDVDPPTSVGRHGRDDHAVRRFRPP